jgi:predicted LPLAT superfamily acyltransferase
VHETELQNNGDAFHQLMNSRRPALLGTCHFGNSDLLGFLLAKFRHPVHMIRLRVGNSRDTHRLADRFGQWVRYLWVNQSENLLFALKEAAQSGGSLVMMCDRIEYSSKVETFHFLGAQRQMPFTIYHLALLFRMPVALCLSVPGRNGNSEIHVSTVFEPEELTKEANLTRAREHFQAFLSQLDALLTINPYLWFNALPKAAMLATTVSKPTVQAAA